MTAIPFALRLYLNSALANSALFGLLALWNARHALAQRAPTPDYRLACTVSQVVLVALGGYYSWLRLTGYLVHQTMLPWIYYLVALIVLPCVQQYVQARSPRQQSFSLALACIFTGGMILRALQTSVAPH